MELIETVPGSRTICLTFDDGPNPADTPRLLEVLRGHRVPAVMRPARAGDPPTLFADGSRAREVLGFVPELSDLDTIMRTAAPFFVAETRHAG